ncbi:unnamed protein product [Prunus armeniaca]|uniref:Uncharacterized protein n=1 Tax=Prunus armeniaca TaxID=36596 RepID=A0A6J5Y8C9_PRUAR|nr:unnamed protein product [Prunus armeniaca]
MGNHIGLTITRDIEMEAVIEFRKALLTLVMVIVVVMALWQKVGMKSTACSNRTTETSWNV